MDINTPCLVDIAQFVPGVLIDPSVPISPPPVIPPEDQHQLISVTLNGPPDIPLGSLVSFDITGHIQIADRNSLEDAIGIAISYDASSGSYEIANLGNVTNDSWSLELGKPYFLGENGELTNSINTSGTPNIVFLQFIGYATSPKSILLSIDRGVSVP